MKIGQDSILGFFFAVIGCIALGIAFEYPFGTAVRMGPGYFPVIISSLLVMTGIGLLIRSISASGDAFPTVNWKALIMVPAAVVAFGLSIEPLGFLPAVLLLLVLSAATSAKFQVHWKVSAGALIFAGLCTIVFVELIGLPMPVLGTLLQ